jgi:hypothetical protein
VNCFQIDVYAADGTPALGELGLGQYIGLQKMVTDTIAQALEAEASKRGSA